MATGFALAATAPSISFTSISTSPFSILNVAGSGFAPNETVRISLGLNFFDAVANANGDFINASVTIPNLSSGVYIILGVGQASGRVAFNQIWVSPFYPNASPNAWHINPGSTLTWSGNGFAPNETITITDQFNTQFSSFVTDSNGAFSSAGASQVPYSLRNTIATFTLNGNLSGISLPFILSITEMYPFANPSSWYALPGTNVTFSGGGFGANEEVGVHIGGNPLPVTSFFTDSTGAFTDVGNVTLPFGTANYQLIGHGTGLSVSIPVTLAAFYPSVSPSTWYAPSGNTVTFSGSGFAPNEMISVSNAASGSFAADSTGSFAGKSFTLPNINPATFTFTGQSSGAVASNGISVAQRSVWTTLSNYWAQGGSPLTIFGHGFANNETVSFSQGGNVFGSTAADGQGDFSFATTVPFAPSGDITVTATGQSSSAVANSQMFVAPVWTNLQLGSYAGAPGVAITFIGSGYLPNEPIQIMTDRTGTTIVHTFNADNNGVFNNSGYTIPADFAEGDLTLTVKGTNSFTSKDIVFYVTGN